MPAPPFLKISDFRPTHTIKGVRVQRLPNMVGRNIPAFYDEEGNRHYTMKARAIPLEPDARYAKPVEPPPPPPNVEAEPETSVPAKLFEFQTRDIACAIMATLGAHQNAGFVVDGNDTQGEYQGRADDGSYIVIARIKDWRQKTHKIYRIHVPQTLIMEIE